MKKQNCNIVKDLLPLYIEEICSEDSKKYVDNHLQECKECQETYELLKKTEFTDLATIKQEINAMKKLNKNIAGKILHLYLLFIGAIVISVFLLIINVRSLSSNICFLLMPLTMLATCAAFNRQTSQVSIPLHWKLLFGGQIILLLYSIVLMFLFTDAAIHAKQPFGIPVDKMGPFLATQQNIITAASLILLAIHLYQTAVQKIRYTPASNVSILCIFLNLIYHSMLYNMRTPESFWVALEKSTLIALAIGIITNVFLMLVGRKLSPNKSFLA